jgi:hypothetical protein
MTRKTRKLTFMTRANELKGAEKAKRAKAQIKKIEEMKLLAESNVSKKRRHVNSRAEAGVGLDSLTCVDLPTGILVSICAELRLSQLGMNRHLYMRRITRFCCVRPWIDVAKVRAAFRDGHAWWHPTYDEEKAAICKRLQLNPEETPSMCDAIVERGGNGVAVALDALPSLALLRHLKGDERYTKSTRKIVLLTAVMKTFDLDREPKQTSAAAAPAAKAGDDNEK